MATLTLTKQQIKDIKKEMDEEVEMLTDAQIYALVNKVNDAVNLPFVNEEKEAKVFYKVIKWIDRKLYQLLPNEYYTLVKDAHDGISKEEAVQIEERLTPLINNVVNIPILTEKHEAKLISIVLGLIIKAMVKGFNLEEVDPE